MVAYGLEMDDMVMCKVAQAISMVSGGRCLVSQEIRMESQVIRMVLQGFSHVSQRRTMEE